MAFTPTQDISSNRILSLDVFRGLVVVAMILVNNPGDWLHIYPVLEHAPWNGCTPTDLIFPFFLFIVGISIVFAFESKRINNSLHRELILKAVKRALILFFLGIILSLFPKFDWSVVRIPGVLQRISLVYFFSAFIFLKCSFRFQLIFSICVLVGYNLALGFFSTKGIGIGSYEPDTNIGAWLDRSLLTIPHLYKQAKTWDPEGIFSTFPALITGLTGVMVGTWIRKKNINMPDKLLVIALIGFILFVLGSIWSLFFPLNKSLWTSSFVLYTGGLAMLSFTTLYWIIDVKKIVFWTKPFLVFGVNAITVFFLSGITARILNFIKISWGGKEQNLLQFLYQWAFVPCFSPINASLAGAIILILIWLGILWILHHFKIIIKI